MFRTASDAQEIDSGRIPIVPSSGKARCVVKSPPPPLSQNPAPKAHDSLFKKRLRQAGLLSYLLTMPGTAATCVDWAARQDPWPLGTVLRLRPNPASGSRGGIYEAIQPMADGLTNPFKSTAWNVTDKWCVSGETPYFPASVDLKVRRFGLWTNKALNFNDRVAISPWWIGSNTGPVNIGAAAKIMANVLSGGDAQLRSMGEIKGDLWHTGTYTTQSLRIWGELAKKPTLTALSIALPDMPAPAASAGDQFAQPDASLELAPGEYGTVTVNSRATLVLHGGEYRIKQFNVEPNAKIEVSFNGAPLRMRIREGLNFKRDAAFTLVDGDASDMLWMVHGTAGVHIGGNAEYDPIVKPGAGFQGTLIAPNAAVNVASDGAVIGAIYADALTIHQGYRFLTVVPFDGNTSHRDSDGDDLEDSTELRIGSDPRSVDSDADGLSDALELWGRGTGSDGKSLHRFGAESAMKTCREAWSVWKTALLTSFPKRPTCKELDGFLPPRDNRTFLHPTRRDAFLRSLWEPASVFGSSGLNFEEVAGDLWVNQAMASSFAKRENYHAVADSDVAFIPSREIALHVDAGPGASVNMPADVDLFGGPYLVSSGGVNTGIGPWDYDIPGKPMDTIDNDEQKALMKRMGEDQPHSQSFWDLFTYAFLTRRSAEYDVWGVASGIGGDYLFLGRTPVPARQQSLTLMHEYGHTLGLSHIRKSIFGSVEITRTWIWEGVMNYGTQFLLGCTMDKWDPITKKGSVNDTRWCGDLPPVATVPEGHPRAGQEWYQACSESTPLFFRDERDSLAWTCAGTPTDYGNRAPLPTDIPKRMGDGELDLTTGYQKRYPINRIEASDFTFSRGRLCSQKLSALNEMDGLSICKERGVDLPQRISFGPIDFNANGIIDPESIDLYWNISLRNKWFWSDILESQDDRDEWGILKFGSRSVPIQIPCSKVSRWQQITLETCNN